MNENYDVKIKRLQDMQKHFEEVIPKLEDAVGVKRLADIQEKAKVIKDVSDKASEVLERIEIFLEKAGVNITVACRAGKYVLSYGLEGLCISGPNTETTRWENFPYWGRVTVVYYLEDFLKAIDAALSKEVINLAEELQELPDV